MGRPDASDLAFLDKFKNCGFQKECWTHEAHVRMAWTEIAVGPFTAAVERIRAGIQKFNSHIQSTGYHDSVTIAFARVIHWRMQEARAEETWPEFLARNSDILAKAPPFLEQFYSPTLLSDPRCKNAFVPPDRKPLPLEGTVRLATPDDAAQMIEIYAPHITDSSTSFEVTVPTEQEFRKRVQAYLAWAPWYVLDVGGQIAGYAYASKHRERAAYQWTVEVSAYNHPKFHRQGVGRLHYTRLFAELEKLGFHLALAGITLPNPQSVGFHEALGFTPVGVYKNIGFKFGKWHDVGWWQKSLKPEGVAPRPLDAIRTTSGPK